MNWLIRQLKQPSTWKGIFILAGIAGYSLDPELQNQIITAVIAVLGIIEIIKNEDKPADTVNIQLPPIELVGQALSATQNRSIGNVGGAADVAGRHIPDAGYRVSVSPDYQPKQPKQPIDQSTTGWNG